MSDGVQSGLVLGTQDRDQYRITDGIVDVSRPGVPPSIARIKALPQEIQVDLHKSAIVVVDMQNDFCSEGGLISVLGMSLSHAQALFEPINRVIGAARAQHVPIVWLNWGVRADRANLPAATQYTFSDRKAFAALGAMLPPTGARREPHAAMTEHGWGAATVDALDQQPQDIRVNKHRISGFWDTELDSVLRSLEVRTLFFAGVNSDHCVLGTLMDANFKGYDTVMIEDCTATTSPDFCHEATLHNVRLCFGFTASADDFAAGIGSR